jgi:LAO/AO transport system ATPase
MLDALVRGLKRRDRRSLARLISIAARGESIAELVAQLGAPPKSARVIALTGAGGVGKSTLTGKLIEMLRAKEQSVAVLACDPQSPITGGALLGDRFRMPMRPDDAGVYIRSLAAPSGRQAVAQHLDTITLVCEHFGFDYILVETVGAGQGDTAVRDVADAVVLLLQPETGDDLQWEKAGVLEVVDMIVVHKADLPGAERTIHQLQMMLEMAGQTSLPVFPVSSRSGAGLDDLVAALERVRPRERVRSAAQRRLWEAVQAELLQRWKRLETDGAIAALCTQPQWQAAVSEAVEKLCSSTKRKN